MNSKNKSFKRRILVVSGPSGVGKTTLCDRLVSHERNRLKICVTATTRKMRQDEVDGKDYFFITEAEFKKGIKGRKFIEYTRIFGNYYGTPVSSLETIFSQGKYPILRVDIDGAANYRKMGYQGVYILIMPPDRKTLEERLINRQSKESKAEIAERLKRAKKELKSHRDYDFRITNDKIADAIKEIQQIIKEHLYK